MASFKSSVFGILMLILIISIAAAAADNYTSSEQDLKVIFTDEFDVPRLTRKGYQDFLANLRNRLKVMDIGTTNKVAVLPPDSETNPQWFNVRLTGADRAQTLVRFRVGNLYVIGYQKGEKWYELRRKGDKKWIDEAEPLGFRGDYGDLQRAANMAVTRINLNKANWGEAVKTLATSTKSQETAAALVVVIQLVSEACRFVVLSNHFSARINSANPLYLEQWMLDDLERNWGAYSKILLCSNMFPTSFKFPADLRINNEVIRSADDLRKRLGILLNVVVNAKECKITGNDVELPSIIDFQAQVQNPVALAGVEA